MKFVFNNLKPKNYFIYFVISKVLILKINVILISGSEIFQLAKYCCSPDMLALRSYYKFVRFY